MLKASLKNLFAHKMRLLMTVLAIVLGVAFVAGTFIFTDSLNRSLEQLFDNEPADIVVSPVPPEQLPQQGARAQLNPTMDEAITDDVADIGGISRAWSYIEQVGTQLLDANDEPIGGTTSVPIGATWVEEADDEPGDTIVEGSRPTSDDEVALDSNTADKAGVGIGDTVQLATPRNSNTDKEWTVTGLADLGLTGGVTVVLFDLSTAQRVLVEPGQITQVRADLDEGADAQAVVAAIQDKIGPNYEVLTGAEAADAAAAEVTDALGFLNTFLLVFALIAVVVAGFLIFNTFAMLVAQRARELALLRALGASRDQVRLGVLVEAGVVGLISAAIGLLAGIGLSMGLRELFVLLGIDLPSGALVIAPRTYVAALLVGVVVTVLSAWAPASRAARVPPVAAMRDEVVAAEKPTARRIVGGGALVFLAALTGAAGVLGGGQIAPLLVGVSALFAILAVVVLSAYLARPVLAVLGLPFRPSFTGRLAVLNARRNPRRTAATASALTIGVTLMAVMSVLAASISATADESIEKAIGADFIISDATFRPFDAEIQDTISEVNGVDQVTSIKTGTGSRGSTVFATNAVEPGLLGEAINLDFTQGALTDISDNQTAIDTDLASSLRLGPGDTLSAEYPGGITKDLEVVGVFEPAALITGVLVNRDTGADIGVANQDTAVYVSLDGSANADAVRADLETALKDYPNLEVQDQAQIKEDFRAQINQLLGFVFALLALAVVIAMLGIVNTLQMSVVERTRELGMLRAVGATRPQVRRMVIVEALLLAVFGAILGVALGLLYGFMLRMVLEPEGVTTLAIPWGQLLLFVVIGGLGGLLAAVWPAVRASRLNMLQAIATE